MVGLLKLHCRCCYRQGESIAECRRHCHGQPCPDRIRDTQGWTALHLVRGMPDANIHHRQCRQQDLHENRIDLDRYIAYIIDIATRSLFCFCYTMATYSPSPTFYEAAGYLSNASSLSNVSSSVKLEVAKPFPQISSAIRDPNLCAFFFQLYGLFKYLTTSATPSTTRPSIFDMTGRAKWDAWSSTGKKYSNMEQAEGRYIEIAKSLGWVEGITIEDEDADEVDLDALDDDDDDEPEVKQKGSRSNASESGGLGPAVSKAQPPAPVEDHSTHGFAIDNDIAGLTALLEKNMNVDLNARDEFVGKKSTSWILMFADGFSTEIYTVASGSGSRKHGSCKVAIRKRR